MTKLYTTNYEFIKELDYHVTIPDNFTGIIEYIDGDKGWVKDDFYHRIGGPAYICKDGRTYYYIDGNEVPKKEHDLLADIMKLKGLL